MDDRGGPAMVVRALEAGIEVRSCARRDLNRVLEIERASFGRDAWPEDAFLEYWRENPNLFLIARLGRRIAGYSITRTTWRGAELESIAVDPRYRARGVAQALLDATVARLGNASTLRLMVGTDNEAALGFYRQYGFARARLVKRYYGPGRDAWRMRLNLTERRSRPKQQTHKQA